MNDKDPLSSPETVPARGDATDRPEFEETRAMPMVAGPVVTGWREKLERALASRFPGSRKAIHAILYPREKRSFTPDDLEKMVETGQLTNEWAAAAFVASPLSDHRRWGRSASSYTALLLSALAYLSAAEAFMNQSAGFHGFIRAADSGVYTACLQRAIEISPEAASAFVKDWDWSPFVFLQERGSAQLKILLCKAVAHHEAAQLFLNSCEDVKFDRLDVKAIQAAARKTLNLRL